MLVQLHVYLPDADHPAHDTVRVIVKDSTDSFNGDGARTFLDSGALPGFDCPESTTDVC